MRLNRRGVANVENQGGGANAGGGQVVLTLRGVIWLPYSSCKLTFFKSRILLLFLNMVGQSL